MATKKIKMVTILGVLVTPEFAQQNLAKASFKSGQAANVVVEVDETVNESWLVGRRLDSHKYEYVKFSDMAFEEKLKMAAGHYIDTIKWRLVREGVVEREAERSAEDTLVRMIEIFLEMEECKDFKELMIEAAKDSGVNIE